MALIVLGRGPLARAAVSVRPQVMILGVSHFAARRDIHNNAFQNSPLSPERQAQVADIVRRLVSFHPTKVLIEQPMGDRAIEQQYREYLAGHFTLGTNEVYQFGFRIAAASRNPSIYPIDTWGPALIDDKSAEGKRVDLFLTTHFTTVNDPTSTRFEERSDALERNGTYLQLLQYLNTDAAIRANAAWYSVFDGVGRKADDAGAAYVAQWYARNCYIWSNILSVIRPGDRVIVMMGQGHEYLLREFARLDPYLIYIDPLEYLK